MTPAEIIQEVLDLLERPDLEALAYTRFRVALRSAHNVEVMRRDLTTENFLLSDYTVTEGAVSLTLPTRFRKLYRLSSYNAAGDVDVEFKDRGRDTELKNYWGLVYSQVYSIFGLLLNVQGISTDATHLRLQFVRYPTYEDEGGGVWVTDSWIAIEAPELISAYLQHQLALLTEDSAQITTAEKLIQMTRRDFINSYVEEII
jgi:hypothetical protein